MNHSKDQSFDDESCNISDTNSKSIDFRILEQLRTIKQPFELMPPDDDCEIKKNLTQNSESSIQIEEARIMNNIF